MPPIRRDLAYLLSENLPYFQRFDHVKVYYDNGQSAVASALEDAFSYMLAKEALIQRSVGYRAFRLAQVADYLCAIELTAAKYSDHKETSTDNKFFGSGKLFKTNWLKKARRKLLA